MEYRSFGKLDWKVSALGFGTMRLPIFNSDQTNVNMPETTKLIRYAIDRGVNYIDTAYTYHEGNSEVAVGKALEGKYRQKVKIATKLSVYAVNVKEDLDKMLNMQMQRLNTDFIDFYLFHTLNRKLWAKMKTFKMIEWAEQQIAKGKLGHLGFSFHDSLDVFKEIVDNYDGWTLAQIQYNYLNENFQAGKEGLKYAAKKGLAVVVMEPLSGGMLAVSPPSDIQEIWRQARFERSPADWALQWVWNQPEVSVVLSGMNSKQQVSDNIESACKSGPNKLTEKELALLTQTSLLYHELGYIGCTKCRYCSHCPKSIDIPIALEFLNKQSTLTGNQLNLKREYNYAVPPDQRASNCQQCGQCEAVCPQHLPVRKLLAEAATNLESS